MTMEMFAALRVDATLLKRAGIRHITDREARDEFGFHSSGNLDGIVFPYFTPTGERVNARIRRDHPDMENGKPAKKYVSVAYDHRRFYYPPDCVGLLADTSVPVIFVEAEKSVLAIWALAQRTNRRWLPVGTGGDWGWRGRIGKAIAPDGSRVDEKGPLPDFDHILWKGGRRVIVWPDTNIHTNRHVQDATEALLAELRRRQASAFTVHPLPENGINGPDDFIATHTDTDVLALLDRAREWLPFQTPPHWKRLDVAELETWECEPFRPIIDGMLAHGNFALMVAATQTGKTLLSLYLARMLLQGGELFGKYKITPVDRLLYLLLEDPDRRAKELLLDTAHEFPDPLAPGRFILQVAPGFNLADERMFAWLEDIITAEQREIVVIDTYQKATPGIASYDDEQQGIILHRLSEMSRRLHVTLIILDHFRKRANGSRYRDLEIEDIKGTGGKPQNADCVILMERTADRSQLRFSASSKDFDAPVRILLNIAPRGSTERKFQYAGDLDELGNQAREHGLETDNRILEILSQAEGDRWMTTSLLAAAVDLAKSTVRDHLTRLTKQGKAEDNGLEGRWRAYRSINGGPV